MKHLNDLQAGKAGEYLVCADLILRGHIAFPSEQGLPFDVVAVIGDKMIKIQVKATRTHKSTPQRKTYSPVYLFNIKRCGKNGKGVYQKNDVDIFALVALDKKIIGYLSADKVKQTMLFRIKEHQGKYWDERSETIRPQIKQLRDSGMTFGEIGKTLGLDRAYVYRVFRQRYNKRDIGQYLEDCTLENAI
jgi:hypothetical protein